MRIAFVNTLDARDVRSWSGIPYHMARTFEEQGVGVEYISPLEEVYGRALKTKIRVYRLFRRWRLIHGRLMRDREPGLLRAYSRQVRQRLELLEVDIVFSPETLPVSKLRIDKPIVFWTDATFAGMTGFYPEFSNLMHASLRNGHRMEQQAIARCSLAIYSSDWARQTAIDGYRVDPSRVKVVPFGANMPSGRASREIESLVDARRADCCRLLFNGVYWQRKGGDLAVKITEELNRRGIPASLDVVGCTPTVDKSAYVKVHGFVEKSSAAGVEKLASLFARSHFLVLPARADCAPLVLAEACSYGVPCLVSRVGGIPTLIRGAVNGKLFAPDANVSEYCDYIAAMMSNPPAYRKLALGAFEEYSERLNWEASIAKVRGLMQEYCL